MYLSKNPQLMDGFKQLGYPAFFVTILGLAKLAGGIALLLPKAGKVNEWAYAGFTFVLIGAIWTHLATHTPFVMPLVILILLAASYWFRARIVKGGEASKQNLTPSYS